MEQNTKKELRSASLSDDDATDILLSKDAKTPRKANERAHRTFCTYLKEKEYKDVNFANWSPEMVSLSCQSYE